MASLFTNSTTYADLVTADSDFREVVWSKTITQTHRYKSVWRHFTGTVNEAGDSGVPISRKTDLEAGMGQDVVYTTVAPILGQGKLGENLLRESTQEINSDSFRVRVDLERQGIAFSQLINWLRNGFNPEQKALAMLADWAVRKHDDNIFIKLREYARLSDPGNNLARVNNRAATGDLLSADTVTPTSIEATKARVMALGAKPLANDLVESGAVCPQFLYIGPDAFMRPLRSNATYLGTLQQGDIRGKDNALFTGRYQMWDNNIIYPHIIQTHDGDGRQGSPQLPLAFLGTAITEGTSTTITGGGTRYAAGTGDYFANFPGFSWYIVDGESLPADSATYYAMIYNLSGADIGEYEIVSYTAAGVHATGKQITVTRVGTANPGNSRAANAGRYSQHHPSGSVILPCTIQGVPLGWSFHMGADALRFAVGMLENKRTSQTDDFELLQGVATNTIRGMAPFVDGRSIACNYLMVEGAVDHPFAKPVAWTGSN